MNITRRQTVPGAKGVFVTYRRKEGAGYAGRLCDRLVDHFGPGRVFRDVDDIGPGRDFVEVIDSAVASCLALIVLIDPDWVTVTDERGSRRLEDPHDFVRLEVESALGRGIPVLPLLVGGALPMRAEDLPPSIQPLARKQALVLSEARTDFEADTDRIIHALEEFGVVPEKGVRRKEQTAGSVSWAWWLMPIFFGVVGGGIAWAFVRSENRRRARNLLIAGIVVTLIAVSIGIGAASQNSNNNPQPPPPPTAAATVSKAFRCYQDVSQAVNQFVNGSASEEDIAAAFGRQSAEYQIGNEVVARFGNGLAAGDPVAIQAANDLAKARCTQAYPG